MIARVLVLLLKAPVHFYRYVISPWLGPNCRFQPTCSAYALEALKRHGPLIGPLLALRRLGRCHPLGGHGYDPVPDGIRFWPRRDAKSADAPDNC
ncbi:MAG: membrane protein insertion efficiency factor YidD [Rhizobiales bacterium NRL2]|jgi:hypothetical protein|nr:MAG: membrane protein insertion efficiency factor YidD [Rhizobiales bacterium NRL2]